MSEVIQHKGGLFPWLPYDDTIKVIYQCRDGSWRGPWWAFNGDHGSGINWGWSDYEESFNKHHPDNDVVAFRVV